MHNIMTYGRLSPRGGCSAPARPQATFEAPGTPRLTFEVSRSSL